MAPRGADGNEGGIAAAGSGGRLSWLRYSPGAEFEGRNNAGTDHVREFFARLFKRYGIAI